MGINLEGLVGAKELREEERASLLVSTFLLAGDSDAPDRIRVMAIRIQLPCGWSRWTETVVEGYRLPFLGDVALLSITTVSAQAHPGGRRNARTYLQFPVQVPQSGLELWVLFRHLDTGEASIRGKWIEHAGEG